MLSVFLDGELEGKRKLEESICKCADNIKLHLLEIAWDGLDWTRAQRR